jgi:hypothetical protein
MGMGASPPANRIACGYHKRSRAPHATAQASVGKLEPAFDPIESGLEHVDLGILAHIGDVQAGNVSLDSAEPEYDLTHIIRKAVNARTDVSQVLEHDIGRLFRHS